MTEWIYLAMVGGYMLSGWALLRYSLEAPSAQREPAKAKPIPPFLKRL